jgi:UDP-glucose 4-epimerase
VSKLAGEELAMAYRASFGLPTVALRYFTVYGPGQRPDMAFHRFVRALLERRPLKIYGDGRQTRDFTYVGDAVEANLLAASAAAPGPVYNIGGGSPAALLEVVAILEKLSGQRAQADFHPRPAGDPQATAADTSRARAELGYAPAVDLEEGLRRMLGWMAALLAEGPLGEAAR